MKQISRRLTAVLCAFCMLFASMPVSAYTDPTPATPTDLAPVEVPAQEEIPEAAETEETQDIPEAQDSGEAEAPTAEESETVTAPEARDEDSEPAEEPVAASEPETADETGITKPEANQEVTGSDDITVTGSLEGNPPADCLIRYTPEKDQTLCLILTANGELKATVTDENTGAEKLFVFDHTDENGQSVLTLPYYKVKQDSTYLIRLSGDKPAEFSIRMVKMSILKTEEEAAEAQDEEPAEAHEDSVPEMPAETTEEILAEPAADVPEETPEESPAEPLPETTAETAEETPAEPAEEAPEETPADTEPESVPETPEGEPTETTAEAPVEIRIDAAGAGTEASVTFLSDAGIPEDAELRVRELTQEEQSRYQARTVRALECGDESYLYYTKYLEISLLHDGEPVELTSPVTLSVVLPDVVEGAGALQAVRFGTRTARLMDSEWDGRAISFRTDAFAVFGIGNALMPLDTQETELASVEVLGFSEDAEVSLKEAEAPEVEEGLEVLASFTVEDQTGTASGTEDTDGLWIKAELNGDADLPPMESVSLYRVEDGQAEMMVEGLSQNSDITELNAQQVAVIRDTGYRHLTLTVSPEDGNEDQTVTLDGMMPKEAEATVTEVTEQYTDYLFETKEPETGHAAEATQTEAAGPADNNQKQTEVLSDQEASGTRTILAAYDISISHADGEYQPDEDKPISVEIADSRIKAAGNIELWHIRDDGSREQLTDFTVEAGRITFEAAGFSVYAVIIHEEDQVSTPRVEFHFIRKDAEEHSDGSNAYYEGIPYPFRNKNNEQQTTQILSDGESLELITDPVNQTDQYFYGWYVVDPFVISGTTDEYGIGTENGKLYYTWPALPEFITFESPISIREDSAEIGETVHWSLKGVSGSGKVDRDGSVHVFLAPVYDKYNFVNFMLYARNVGVSGANTLMTRKLIAMGSAESVEMKVSDIRSTSRDAVHLIFTGWEYQDRETGEWTEIKTVDPTGAEIIEPGRDGVYLTSIDLQDTSSIDLYPIFVEARWTDFVSGITGSGASFVGSRFLEAWGRATPDGTQEEEDKNIYTRLGTSVRKGYSFEGWYAFAVTDPVTGEITNLNTPRDVTVTYIDDNYVPHTVTISTKAIRITNADGTIAPPEDNGPFRLDTGSGMVQLFSTEGGRLRFFDPLDRLTLYANWTPEASELTIVYWTENEEDDKYTSSAIRNITTAELNDQLGTSYASGSEITLDELAAYVDEAAGVSVLNPEYLDDVGAVPEAVKETVNGQERILKPTDAIFYDLNTDRSDASKVIDGEGSTIFNVYFSRKVFRLVFHIGRDNYVKNGGNQRTDANWDGNWIEWMYMDNKVNGAVSSGGLGYPKHTDRVKQSHSCVYTMTFGGKNYTSEYVTTPQNVMGDYLPSAEENLYIITAKYGSDISSLWPSYSNKAFSFHTDQSGFKYFPYIWSAYYGSLYCRIANERSGAGNDNGKNPDINGIYKYMSAELCANRTGDGIINANQVHHLVAWFGEATNQNRFKQYHTLYEAIDGTYNPDEVEVVPGTDYVEFEKTTWTEENTEGDKKEIIGHSFYEIPSESPLEVLSNLEPRFQLSSDIDGYQFVYSCYEKDQRANPDNPGQKDYHVYFFYRPMRYSLTFMYEDAADRKTDQYYYRQSLKEARKYPDPEKEGYRFRGWFTNEVAGKDEEPFDFENATMPSHGIVLYPVFEKLEYVIRIDPNGGVIDHWTPGSTSSGASTGFRANYKEKISAYNFLERNYLKTSNAEISTLGLDPDNDVYYYLNTQYLGEEHDGNFIPSRLRNALYLTAAGIDDYWAWYSAVPESEFAGRRAVKFTDKDEWMDAYFGGHELDSLTKYRLKRGVENYSFMGWYQVYEDGSLARAPFDFNTQITKDVEIRALWRLDGGYYIQYKPSYYVEDGEGSVTAIIGEMEQWNDPEQPNLQLYADQSPTHILRAPTNVTPGWVFRGWRVVRAGEEKTLPSAAGGTVTFTDWQPIQFDADGNVVYYQPGDSFTVNAEYVTENSGVGAVIYMQAYYEPEDDTARRPEITNLILDANDAYGGYLNSSDQSDLAALDRPGSAAINTEDNLDGRGNPTQILFGDIQSNQAIHLYRYASTKTFDSVQGTNLFSNDGPYFLIGFDEEEDPLNPSTGSAYVPAYFPDSVIGVTRDSDITLYAMWEPKIYITFVNTTDEDIQVRLSGNGTETVRIVNMVTGEYDREETTGTITVPARTGGNDGMIRVVLPRAAAGADTFTATAVNDHTGKKISAAGTFRDEDPYGTGSKDIPYGYDVLYSGVLQIDPDGIYVTYTEKDDRQVDYDVNGGTWMDGEPYKKVDEGLYSLESADITDNDYEPEAPTHDSRIFIGWTTNTDIAAHSDFSGEHAVTWGDTVIIPEEGESLLDRVKAEFLWDFSQDPPYDQTLYAVWSEMVTVTFDLYRANNQPLHIWNGPATTNVDGGHVFYRENENSRYVTYKLIPGEMLPKPDDPTASANNWYFVSWLTINSYTNKTESKLNTAAIVQNTFDFSKPITDNVHLYTCWTGSQPQYYTFTVENHVINGSDNDEFTYRITVSEEAVWGKLGTSGQNSVGTPDIQWGYADVRLKNNQQYTVRITVKYYKPASWDGCSVEMDVYDADGNAVRKGQITYANKNGNPKYVGGYKYHLTITQQEEPGYETGVEAGTPDGVITNYTTDDTARAFDFDSKWGSTIADQNNTNFTNAFTPSTPVNGYVAGQDNKLTIVFTNTKTADETIVAPTGFSSRYLPYILMLAAGLILMLLLGCAGIHRRQGKENGEEAETDTSLNDIGTGPPERGRIYTEPIRKPKADQMKEKGSSGSSDGPEGRGDPGG